jgi:hypothetical protein
VEEVDAGLSRRLKHIVEETTAGDPMSPLKWTSKSTRTIAEELTRSGHPISSVTVGRCLEEMGTPCRPTGRPAMGLNIPIEMPSSAI